MNRVQTDGKLTMMDYVYRVSAGVANAVLVMLGIGLLIETIGGFIHWPAFAGIGTIAKSLLAPAFGVAIAYQLKGNTLVVFSAMVAATVGGAAVQFVDGANAATGGVGLVFVSGQPISAVIAGIIAAVVGIWLTGKTILDMVFIPLVAVVIGGVAGLGLAAVTTPLLVDLSAFMAQSITISPLIGSSVIGLVWSILLMTPASSAALAIAIQLDPVSSAAALIGCTAQFVGFTVMSFRQNDLGGNLAQGLITPKVQFPNLVKNPQLVAGPFLAALICAPIATLLFGFKTSYELAGLGLNSLIAPIAIFGKQGQSDFIIYVIAGVILPAIITYSVHRIMLKCGWVKPKDLSMIVM